MRPRIILFGLAAIIIVALIVLSLADQFLVDFLWFSSLGYRGVFNTIVGAEVAIFAAVWVIAFVAILISGSVAVALSHERERLHVVRRSEEIAEVNLPELIRSFSDRIPWRLLVVLASAILAIFPAQGEAAGWDTYLKALYRVPFHASDRSFGHDVGFYIFTLPLLEGWRDLFLVILFLAAALAVAIYWARGAMDFRESPPRITPGAAAHMSGLIGIFFIQRAMSYWLSRYGLLLHTNGVVFGLRYVDRVLWQPGLWLLVVLSLVAAVLCFANLRVAGVRLPVVAFVIVFGPSILLSFIQPIIERLWVKPDELRIERPYLSANIEMTRAAYKLDSVDVKPFGGSGTLTRASLQADAPTIKNIRLWDPRPLSATYRQLQEIRLYYDFKDVDIDRYTINGQYTQVMLSPRELNVALLPENAQTWVNQHLKFTHGSGLVMSPVNKKDPEGLPVFLIKNIPPESSTGFDIKNPAIYFGEEPDNYAVVNSATPEFDYPSGTENVFAFYKGTGGIRVSGLARRLVFSFFFKDINLLVTENIVAKSRILIRRNIVTRLATLAPFLNFDRDPYIVVHDGRLVWIVDAYTASDHYPYSQRNADGINYIRNSVKAVIDAYDGTTTLYVSDPDDPIIQTWERIFPSLFKPLSAMPDELHKHIRYPEDFFLIQADIYRTYHMRDPQVFYNREDQWGFARENYAGETVRMQPYYVVMRLPGESHEEYMLMLPMVPQGRDNMIAWMAARCDGADYGHLFEYSFSKDRLFYGPYQIQARINQSPDISRQLSLWNQMGSKVILGNLLVIPVQDSLLYVEPLYIRAENGQLPELQRVIASYSDQVVMGETLSTTLNALFTAGEGVAPPVVSEIAPQQGKGSTLAASAGPAAAPPPSRPGMEAAATHYNNALKALSAGNWTEFGAEMQKLGHDLGQNGHGPSH
jgi:uncharacterized membrane protein (UPF0182 family)